MASRHHSYSNQSTLIHISICAFPYHNCPGTWHSSIRSPTTFKCYYYIHFLLQKPSAMSGLHLTFGWSWRHCRVLCIPNYIWIEDERSWRTANTWKKIDQYMQPSWVLNLTNSLKTCVYYVRVQEAQGHALFHWAYATCSDKGGHQQGALSFGAPSVKVDFTME